MNTTPFQHPRTLPVILFTFIAWLLIIILLHFLSFLSGTVHLFLHNSLSLLCFGSLFFLYFRSHRFVEVFPVTAGVMLTFLVSEAAFWLILYPGQSPYSFTFLDWVLPVFFMITSVYFVGKFVQRKKREY